MDLDHSGGVSIMEVKLYLSNFLRKNETISDSDLKACFQIRPEEDLSMVISEIEFSEFTHRLYNCMLRV